MLVRFADDSLSRLETDPAYTHGLGVEVVRSFRKKMGIIRVAQDERDLYAMKSLHFEKLKGKRAHQHSIRLNQQWRLVLEFEKTPEGKVVVVMSIEDYH